jgi:hypothetical protein
VARRVVSVSWWACLLVLGAFGAIFSFANYPLYATGLVLLILVLAGHAERARRTRQQARDAARLRARAGRPLT